MKQVVYVDILLTTNLFVNYFLLLSCSKLLKIETKRLRLCFGASFGAISSLVIFLPEMNFFIGILFRLLVSSIIIYISFGSGGLKRFLKLFLSFMAANFLFAGSMMALWFAFKPGGMVINNNVTYFDISITTLILTTVICYGVVTAVSRAITRKVSSDVHYIVNVTFDSVCAQANGYLDTGNALVDCFSGYPVIISNSGFLKKLLFDEEIEIMQEGIGEIPDSSRLKNRIRLIPFGTIKDKGMLKAFKPDFIEIKKENRTIFKTADVYIAMGIRDFDSLGCDILLNPKIFEAKEMLLEKRS